MYLSICIYIIDTKNIVWLNSIYSVQVEEEVNDVVLVLVQNKIDILDQAAMSQ